MDLVCRLLEVLHVMSQHKVPQSKEVAVILKIKLEIKRMTQIFSKSITPMTPQICKYEYNE